MRVSKRLQRGYDAAEAIREYGRNEHTDKQLAKIAAMDPTEVDLKVAIRWAMNHPIASLDWMCRPIYVTQFPGAYGPAGFVITIEGSPVRAVLTVCAKGGVSSSEPLTGEDVSPALHFGREFNWHGIWSLTPKQRDEHLFRRIVADFLNYHREKAINEQPTQESVGARFENWVGELIEDLR